jgi:hypothetical protein
MRKVSTPSDRIAIIRETCLTLDQLHTHTKSLYGAFTAEAERRLAAAKSGRLSRKRTPRPSGA